MSEMLVTTDWLVAHLHDSELVVLCVADDEQFYSTGHIPGARLILLQDIVTTKNGVPNQLLTVDHLQEVFERAGVNSSSRIVLYGERQGVLAARTYFTLDYLGLADHASLLDGGIEKWRAEGREESKTIPQFEAGRLDAHLHPEILVDSAQVAEYAHTSSSEGPVLLDARPPAEYSGETLSEDVSKAGHIPHAKSLYWFGMLHSEADPELRPIPELKPMFAAAGATPGKEVITYCRTGMQSSFDYFVAKYLGYSPRMYVGSFYEWARSPRAVESNVEKK